MKKIFILLSMLIPNVCLSSGNYSSNFLMYRNILSFVTTIAGLALTSGSTDGTGSAARFSSPDNIAFDPAGNMYVPDESNCAIRKVTPGGVVTTFAGLMGSCGYADGTGSAARFSYPNNIASDSAGNLYTTEYSDTIRRITPSGVVTTLAGLANSAAFADGTGSGARFNHPSGIIVDSAGYIYVGDTGNYRIRKITPDGVVTTIAGALVGYVDGTGNAAKFNYLQGIAVDSVGNLYAADSVNNAIRKIDPSGVVTTFAGGTSGSTDGIGTAAAFNRPSGISIDSSGNLYVADTNNNTIRKITPGAVVTTIAGLALTGGSTDAIGSAARFNRPKGVIISPAGVAYVADTNNNTIRKISR